MSGSARVGLADVEAIVTLLRSEAILVDDPEHIPRVTADPDDDYLIALAQYEGADAIVSGDGHLTTLDTLIPPVLTPAAACALLVSNG